MVYRVDQITDICVVGFGTMGIGIVQNFVEAGLYVHVVDLTEDALTRGQDLLQIQLKASEQAGIITNAQTAYGLVKTYLWDDLQEAAKNAQMIVETVPEVLDIKKDVFAKLDPLDREILIGSNTSSFTISQMTDHMSHADRVVGLHYFNPAHLIPAVEIHHGQRTSKEAIDTMMAVMEKVGKVPVRVREEVPGFIINRLTGALEREIDFLLDNNIVTPQDLDAAVKASLGFRLACIGPMEAEDFIGLDTAYRVSNNVFKDLSNAQKASDALGEKVARGELGVKSGKGWYDYSALSKDQIFAERDAKLLRQLATYRSNQAKG